MKYLTLALISSLLLTACGQLTHPSVEQAKQDLVGKEIRIIAKSPSYFGQVELGMSWKTLKQVQDLVIQQRFTDKDAKTEELQVLVTATFVTLKDGEEKLPMRGVLVLNYKHFEQGWKLQSVHANGEFSSVE